MHDVDLPVRFEQQSLWIMGMHGNGFNRESAMISEAFFPSGIYSNQFSVSFAKSIGESLRCVAGLNSLEVGRSFLISIGGGLEFEFSSFASKDGDMLF